MATTAIGSGSMCLLLAVSEETPREAEHGISVGRRWTVDENGNMNSGAAACPVSVE